MKKYVIITAGFAVALSACIGKKAGEAALQTVKTDTVRIYGEKQKITFPGRIKAASDVSLSFKVSGTIAGIYAEEGDYVKKGQMLVEIDPRDYAIQLSATEAEYMRVKAEAERVAELYRKGSVTPNDYDKATYGLKQITAKYDAHKNAVNDTKLLAPFDGYIQKRFFGKNETTGAGIPVISMINAGAPEVEINIPSSEFIRRDKFESFNCTVDIYPGKEFPLELIGVAPKANLNQLYAMRLRMKNTDKPLPSPGMTATVIIRLKTEESEMVCIPYSALFEANDRSSVWVYDPDVQTVTIRAVRLHTVLGGGLMIISGGLKAGEIVISAGVHSLREGEKVKLLPPVSPTNTGGLL
ncbi:MAG: efflux RND transporter periplasmic adaptor subunit [Bacteroidales bacterium]|jgi:RND family efflux transporter MFP subunit|nr:efflux RND transporter periplasmic adaptor subunit [Bacteroidales bacterium]